MLNVVYKGSAGPETFSIAKPADFYPAIAAKIAEQEQGKSLEVYAGIDDSHYVTYQVAVRSGTQNITPLRDLMPAEYQETGMKERYLACIDRARNSYKYYRMVPGKDGTFTAKYGRCAVGAGQLFGTRSYTWQDGMYHAKLQEKLAKGYIDISEYMLADDDTELGAAVKDRRERTASSELYDLLHECAKESARRAVNVPINHKLIAKSKELIGTLRAHAAADSLEAFNETLSLLMLILQRSVSTGDGMGVERNMAHSSADYGRIIQREADLCEVMEGAVTGDDNSSGDFSDYGIEVYDATDEQRKFVLRHLGDNLKTKVAKVWRVIPAGQKKKFDAYVENHHITEIKNLWHGSRNENWASIIRKSLLLNPDAVITGKMLGKGIYFAPSPSKSWNYTSIHGTTWAKGRSDFGIMGLYTVAYGKPYDVYSFDSSFDYERTVKAGLYDCCHAHAGQSLRADEIVFYDEAAMLLSYIVEFR